MIPREALALSALARQLTPEATKEVLVRASDLRGSLLHATLPARRPDRPAPSATLWAPNARAVERSGDYETQLLSRAADGGFPNGPSRNGVLSQDGRVARTAAFESDASNIVAGDSNGPTDVFVVERTAGYSRTGRRGATGGRDRLPRDRRTRRTGARTGPPSRRPSSDGGRPQTAPRCVAFVSEASNLVRGDTNGRPDAFVYWLGSGAVQRVSVASDGSQANGSSYDVAVDGACTRVAFTADATNLAQTTGGGSAHPNYKAVKTGATPGGVRQVYARVLRAEKSRDRGLVGLTYLASASDSGVPGNRDSDGPSWSLRTSQVLAFTSTAGNLDARDRNGVEDVYVSAAQAVKRRFGKKGGKRPSLPWLDPRVRVISVNPASQRAGNGRSMQASASDQSCFVIFTTAASDVIPGDTGPTTDIARADIRGFLRSRGVLRFDPPGCRKVGEGGAPAGDRIRITKVARGNGPSNRAAERGRRRLRRFASAAADFSGVTGSDATATASSTRSCGRAAATSSVSSRRSPRATGSAASSRCPPTTRTRARSSTTSCSRPRPPSPTSRSSRGRDRSGSRAWAGRSQPPRATRRSTRSTCATSARRRSGAVRPGPQANGGRREGREGTPPRVVTRGRSPAFRTPPFPRRCRSARLPVTVAGRPVVARAISDAGREGPVTN